MRQFHNGLGKFNFPNFISSQTWRCLCHAIITDCSGDAEMLIAYSETQNDLENELRRTMGPGNKKNDDSDDPFHYTHRVAEPSHDGQYIVDMSFKTFSP